MRGSETRMSSTCERDWVSCSCSYCDASYSGSSSDAEDVPHYKQLSIGIDAGPKRPAEENLGPNPKKTPTPVFKRPMPDYKKLFADKISITDKDTQDVVEFT